MQTKAKTCFILWSLFMSMLLSASILTADDQSKVNAYIVYTNNPKGKGEMAFYIRTLTNVLGSKKAAKKALDYTFRLVSGFVAFLTPPQAKKMAEQPGVDRVIPDFGNSQVSEIS